MSTISTSTTAKILRATSKQHQHARSILLSISATTTTAAHNEQQQQRIISRSFAGGGFQGPTSRGMGRDGGGRGPGGHHRTPRKGSGAAADGG